MASRLKKEQGFALVEVLLATALLVMFFTAVFGAFTYGLRAAKWSGDRIRAVSLAEEGLVAMESLRDLDFSNLTDGTYGLNTSGTQWVLDGTSDTTGIFTREITVSSIDSNVKMITSAVSWFKTSVITGRVSLVSYLTDWQSPIVEFGDWTTMTQLGILDIDKNEDGRRVQILGNYAYLIRNSNDPDFMVIDISDPAVPVLVGELELGNRATGLAITDDYAYVSGQDNSQELLIIDITDPASPVLVGEYNASGNSDAWSVVVDGTTAYIVRSSSSSPEFIAIDVSDPALPTTLGELNLNSRCNDVSISGNYAYVASESNSEELQIVDISDPTAPAQIGGYNLSGSQNSFAVAAGGNMVYLGNAVSLYVLNDTVHGSPTLLNSVNLMGTINDLEYVEDLDYVFAAVSDSLNEIQIVDVGNPSSPTMFSHIDLTGTAAYGVAYDLLNDQIAVAGNDSSAEFLIVIPN